MGSKAMFTDHVYGHPHNTKCSCQCQEDSPVSIKSVNFTKDVNGRYACTPLANPASPGAYTVQGSHQLTVSCDGCGAESSKYAATMYVLNRKHIRKCLENCLCTWLCYCPAAGAYSIKSTSHNADKKFFVATLDCSMCTKEPFTVQLTYVEKQYYRR